MLAITSDPAVVARYTDELDALSKGIGKDLDFSSFKNFDSHYDIHVKGIGRNGAVAEYGDNFTKVDYFNTAKKIASSKVDNVDIFSKMQGETKVIYRKSTNDIVFQHKDGTIGTMFKPKFTSSNPDAGWNYFNNLK